MFIAGTSGIRDVPVDVYCRYVWWRYASSIILAWFIAGTSGGGMHPALYWRGLLQESLVEVSLRHYAADVYCRCVCESVYLALCCRCVLQVRLVEGMYPVFVQDWLRVWPREQLFIMRYEDYGGHERERISELLDFLGMGNQIP